MLFAFQLFGIRHGKPFATAAFAIDGTEKRPWRNAPSSTARTKPTVATDRCGLGELSRFARFGCLSRFVRLVRLIRPARIAQPTRIAWLAQPVQIVFAETGAHRAISALAVRLRAVEGGQFVFRGRTALRATAFRRATLVGLSWSSTRLATLSSSTACRR